MFTPDDLLSCITETIEVFSESILYIPTIICTHPTLICTHHLLFLSWYKGRSTVPNKDLYLYVHLCTKTKFLHFSSGSHLLSPPQGGYSFMLSPLSYIIKFFISTWSGISYHKKNSPLITYLANDHFLCSAS